jgi:3-phenylpropionate/trans-cinnamate dioxygenase ferredoxin subunit
MPFVRVGSVNDFPENRTTGVKADGKSICIARWSGGFYAFDESCTHAHATLADADIEEGEISCPLHGAKFSVTTGKALTLPAVEPVKMYETKQDGPDLLVNV